MSQTISITNTDPTINRTISVLDRIFPQPRRFNLIAEASGFEVLDVENLREHYALTLRQWVNRLEDHRKEAIKAASEAVYRTWRIYMSGCVYGFETGMISVNQYLLSKPANGKTDLPLTRSDLYEAG